MLPEAHVLLWEHSQQWLTWGRPAQYHCRDVWRQFFWSTVAVSIGAITWNLYTWFIFSCWPLRNDFTSIWWFVHDICLWRQYWPILSLGMVCVDTLPSVDTLPRECINKYHPKGQYSSIFPLSVRSECSRLPAWQSSQGCWAAVSCSRAQLACPLYSRLSVISGVLIIWLYFQLNVRFKCWAAKEETRVYLNQNLANTDAWLQRSDCLLLKIALLFFWILIENFFKELRLHRFQLFDDNATA